MEKIIAKDGHVIVENVLAEDGKVKVVGTVYFQQGKLQKFHQLMRYPTAKSNLPKNGNYQMLRLFFRYWTDTHTEKTYTKN